ncbi:unnamed protein product [Adineta steineri]|uniref:Uncharacterized protein n=1 Tax=Adineta steineri TaxID=433720 RepID=A0A815E5Z4_9BILA|nr:unnamed protein product [Adineta steineri]CAF3721121.1 unnamed protein product [Adineta steineri]
MATANPPYQSFLLDDDEEQSITGFNNPNKRSSFENTSSTIKRQFPEKTNSTLIQPSQNVSDLYTGANPYLADNPYQQQNQPIDNNYPTYHNHNEHVHVHTQPEGEHYHHHHQHTHNHGHEHVHEHEPPHQHTHVHEHQHHTHDHQHHQHTHDHQQHQHIHDHDHQHDQHHQHIHTPSIPPPFPPIQQHHDGLNSSALTIRRHNTTDPLLYSFPNVFSPIHTFSPDHMYIPPPNSVPAPPNLHVTIRRNPPPTEHTLIQPILYPVAVYTNASQPIQDNSKSYSSKTRTKPTTPVRTSPIPPVRPSGRSPPLVLPPVRHQPGQHSPPPPTGRSAVGRKSSIRFDTLGQTVRKVIRVPARPGTKVHIQEPSNSNRRRSSVYPGASKQVAYRVATGKTTRELENEEIDDSGAPIFVQTPRLQTVTYRT